MVRFIGVIFIFSLFGCEMNSKQIIKPEKFDYEVIKFDVVSKKLLNDNFDESYDRQIMNNLIQYWFDNRIKTDGFDGSLEVLIKKIDIKRLKEESYYKFSIVISLEFFEQKNNQTKVFSINSSEYGEIEGNFSIKDQESLDINLMHQSLKRISKKLLEKN